MLQPLHYRESDITSPAQETKAGFRQKKETTLLYNKVEPEGWKYQLVFVYSEQAEIQS